MWRAVLGRAVSHGVIDPIAQFAVWGGRLGGVDVFIGHARKAWLKGLSPAQNRSVPPLKYDYIYRLKQDFPHLYISLNGGVHTLDEVNDHLQHVDGVMMGRAAYQQPEMFAEADEKIFGAPALEPISTLELLVRMDEYAHRQVAAGSKLSFIIKHLVGLFKSRPRARRWRQGITHMIQRNPSEFSLAELYLEAFGQGAT